MLLENETVVQLPINVAITMPSERDEVETRRMLNKAAHLQFDQLSYTVYFLRANTLFAVVTIGLLPQRFA